MIGAMIETMRRWYLALSQREQRLIQVAAALAAVTLMWGTSVVMVASLDSARTRYADAVTRLADTRTRLAAIEAARRARGPDLVDPIDTAVRAQAAAAGFVLSGVTPQVDGSIEITIASARAPALFGWVTQLEDHGLIILRFSTTDNGDRTLAVQMTLRKQGR
jgi:general secretion pathway protein M